jgi:hypothetical protein
VDTHGIHLFNINTQTYAGSRIQAWRVIIQTPSPARRGFFPLSLTISVDGASCFLTWRVRILNYSPVWRAF